MKRKEKNSAASISSIVFRWVVFSTRLYVHGNQNQQSAIRKKRHSPFIKRHPCPRSGDASNKTFCDKLFATKTAVSIRS